MRHRTLEEPLWSPSLLHFDANCFLDSHHDGSITRIWTALRIGDCNAFIAKSSRDKERFNDSPCGISTTAHKMPLVSAASLNSRFSQLALIAAFILLVGWFFVPAFDVQERLSTPGLPVSTPYVAKPGSDLPLASKPEQKVSEDDAQVVTVPKPDHPIDYLIAEAGKQLDALLEKETKDVHDAAGAYRKRRGRQPPPGFDKWFKFAKERDAIIVEEFWDQIYDDLGPFWGVPAKQIREQANSYLFKVNVRDGVATFRGDGQDRPWLPLWTNLTSTVAEHLPDVDIPINHMDESRIVVQWEEINEYMTEEKANRRIVSTTNLKDTFQSLVELDNNPPANFDPEWSREGPYWEMAVVGCPPSSAARNAIMDTDFTQPPPLVSTWPEGSYKGYVQNWTLAQSPCDNAHLQGLHGTFVEPISIANSRKFFPLFGGSKLPMNNEILLPAAMYWTDDPFYSGGEDHGEAWKKKKDMMAWRGAASGGRNTVNNWTRFQRHRFVSMMNATSVHAMETEDPAVAPNFAIPTNNSYDLVAQGPDAETGSLSRWIKPWTNVGVVHLLCHPPAPPKGGKWCEYTNSYFHVEKTMPMKDQYAYKYLPDIDGNSFSGRYRGFLGSTSLPIKATIYQEWHDSRLVPWKHFVPMDNTFIDIYGIMEYFIGNKDMGVEGHDEEAKQIAIGGKKWAEKVLRREDMQIYVFRLLLEYARLCDDEREVMGWREINDDVGIT